ncbi:flagellar hook-associated protein FlgK [Eubacterium sp. MSJ-13]|uniref:flagellar hook-associated protein FlgK n=1 Tax=Eubacterium sp. MSJ-13 TaxID=2841513 RepID=UPI001C115E91|nr:flagellar hook-associated protein FlgK [Eubacterium sp. MSJ-13]MBU5477762.1 flagellar hook-associated protein FlgK [Eubacterium sp. MSJ-13]
MPSTFYGLNIAVSGMNTYNAVLNTTAHNISNTKTAGYSKQVVNQQAKKALSLRTSFGMLGSGVEVTDIVNTRDSYYDYKYRKSTTTFGYYDSAKYYMSSIEDYLYVKDDKSGGLSTSLDNFFKSLIDMTTDSTDTTKRAQAAGYADALGEYARKMSTNLQTLQNDLNTEISTTVKQINAYAEQIASLTKQINSLEVYGGQANDLRDQRARVLDELSSLADVEVTEKNPETGNGLHQYIVSLGGNILVDTYSYKTISVEASQTKDNQCDVQGLYNLRWSDGQTFNIRSSTLGGKLQALFEIRDGNNGENFSAKLKDVTGNGDCTGTNKDGRSTITLSAEFVTGANNCDLAKLSIPESNACLTIGGLDYEYDSFEVSVGIDGTYTYTFTLAKDLNTVDKENINRCLKNQESATIGDSVDFRGIPYYMSQINEFIRTFSANINQLQNIGYDMNNDHGVDLFVGTDNSTGKQMDMIELIRSTNDGYYYLNGSKVFSFSGTIDDSVTPPTLAAGSDKNDATLENYLKNNDYTIKANSAVTKNENGISGKVYTLLDKNGDEAETIFIPDDANNIFTFSSSTTESTDKKIYSSYYGITAGRFQANKNVVKDGRLIATAKYPKEKTGIAESGNLDRLVALQNDQNVFKQGTPTAFLQVMTASIGVDSNKIVSAATNAENIQKSIENRRLSVMGVDEDEEAQNLVITQNLLNAQYRVISVMNEVLDKLINQTGV